MQIEACGRDADGQRRLDAGPEEDEGDDEWADEVEAIWVLVDLSQSRRESEVLS